MMRIRYGVALGVIALALVAASPGLAGDPPQKQPNAAEVRNEVRVEMNAAGPGQEPKVRMWVNGKEVEPGGEVPPGVVDQLHAESIGDPGEGKAKTHTRIEVEPGGPDGQGRVRMWVNGKEVEPGGELPPGVVGQLHAESIGDPGDGKAKTHTRIEVEPGGPDGQGRVRMWINGKEVDPGDAVRIGDGKARVQIRAVPSDRDAQEHGEAHEAPAAGGALGVRIAPLEDDLAREVDVDRGVAVIGVLEGSPAALIGLREGDVITAVDGKDVGSPEELVERVGRHRRGQRVRVTWRRPGAGIEATVNLASRDDLVAEAGRRGEERERGEGEAVRPPEPRPRGEMWDDLMQRWREQMRQWQRRQHQGDVPPRPPQPERRRDEGEREDRQEGDERPGGFLGILAAPLNDDIREIAGTDKGVLINSLTDDSPAAKAGLKPGDVIVRIGDAEIHAVDHLVEALRGRRAGERIHMVYFRMGKRRETEVTLGRRPGEAEAREQEGVPLLEDLFGGEMPDLGKYLKDLGSLEEWARQFQEQQRRGGGGEAQPGEAPRRGPTRQDLDRLMQRLDRLERRLDQMEKRLERDER